MKINILTPINKGGPYFWGKNLSNELNKIGDRYRSKHIHRFQDLAFSTIYQNADIVHTAVPLTYRLWKMPVIFTIHGDYTVEKNVWRRFYPTAIKKADVITTPSNYLKNKLGLDKAVVIPNAVFCDNYRSIEYSDKNSIDIITITNFDFKDKSEGIISIIKIIDEAKKSTNKILNYTVVGGGKYLENIKREAGDYKLNIKFTGFINAPAEELKKNDIFLYYSVHDNFPFTILEAMASGLPVISNDVGGVREMLDNNKDGIVVQDNVEYFDNLTNLIENIEVRRKLGVNARRKTINNFNWIKIVNSYRAIYDSKGFINDN